MLARDIVGTNQCWISSCTPAEKFEAVSVLVAVLVYGPFEASSVAEFWSAPGRCAHHDQPSARRCCAVGRVVSAGIDHRPDSH